MNTARWTQQMRGGDLIGAAAGVLALAIAATTLGCGQSQCVRVREGEVPGENACQVFPGLAPVAAGAQRVRISGDLREDTLWTADKVWVLRDFVYVRAPYTLIIEPGTQIQGERGSALVVTRGAKIMAEGTRERPIVFTSSKPPGGRYRGDWGGLNLLGSAPINVAGGENALSGFTIAEGRAFYGGQNPDDSSGVLKYVRVEFGGYALTPDVKLNGLACAGCGRGTLIDYVQVHRAADDGFEVFGGTVDFKHMVITFAYDDGLDWDLGWRGKAQYLVVMQEPNNGDALYEADNLKDSQDAQPRSMPTICNATLIGSRVSARGTAQAQRAMVLRRGTGGLLYNHLVLGSSLAAVDVRDKSTAAVANAGELFVRNSMFFENGSFENGGLESGSGRGDFPVDSNDNGFDEPAFFTGREMLNRTGVDPKLRDPYNRERPDWMPEVGSPALRGGSTPPADGFFDTTASFIGAFGDEDWTAGWTAYPLD